MLFQNFSSILTPDFSKSVIPIKKFLRISQNYKKSLWAATFKTPRNLSKNIFFLTYNRLNLKMKTQQAWSDNLRYFLVKPIVQCTIQKSTLWKKWINGLFFQKLKIYKMKNFANAKFLILYTVKSGLSVHFYQIIRNRNIRRFCLFLAFFWEILRKFVPKYTNNLKKDIRIARIYE